MAAGTYNINIEQRAFFEKLFTYYVGETDVPVDLTGYTAKMQIKPRPESEEVDLELTHLSGIQLGTLDGTIRLTITSAQTSTLIRDGVYDLFLYPVSGEGNKLIKGEVRVSLAVTE